MFPSGPAWNPSPAVQSAPSPHASSHDLYPGGSFYSTHQPPAAVMWRYADPASFQRSYEFPIVAHPHHHHHHHQQTHFHSFPSSSNLIKKVKLPRPARNASWNARKK
ncbi:chromatin modification-related protein EAF1-like [Diaphorina citri]|uniref:Chromatin modification-related protein EAF1-like n=1 Tax=Diaphorina citri TaxID=121845 RepID=A0A1S3DDE5_DIACI|nr:chromatin modification-related protein EAF1-like [Diaphorina citri]